MVLHFTFVTVSSNLDLLLQKDFLHPPSSSTSGTRPWVFNNWTKKNQLNRIAQYRKAVSTALWLQFAIVACFLPFAISLNFIFHASASSVSVYIAISCAFTLVYFNSSLIAILSLLLEDRRSETNSKGHNQTNSSLLIELAPSCTIS